MCLCLNILKIVKTKNNKKKNNTFTSKYFFTEIFSESSEEDWNSKDLVDDSTLPSRSDWEDVY